MRRAGANATLGFVVASLWFHGVAAVVVTAMPKLQQAPINGEIAMPRAAPSIELELTPPPSPTPSATSDASAAEDAAATPQTPQTEQERERERERERQRELEREREREQERQRLRFVTPTMAPAPPPPPPPQQALGRQSVQQSQSNDQQANDARFLAERNNNVAEETVAAVRGTQEDSNNPQHAAAERRAPGQGAGAEDIHDGRRNREGEILAQQEQRLGGRRTPPTSAQAANEPQGAVATQGGAAAGTQGASAGATAPSIEAPTPNRVFAASEGVWGQFSLTQQQRTGVAPRPNQGAAGQGGQNGAGGSGGGIRSQVAGRGAEGVVAAFSPASTDYARAFGSQVEQERRLARERRTEARGESPTESWQQLRQGMENYVQSVRVGNQTALRTAASPFATYLSNMHHRIHRLFADGFLAGLEAGSAENPLNDMNLRSTVEIVLERDGRVSRIGIVRTSGSTMFDVAAMNSVRRSAPFGDAPEAIRSADGKVYIHWGFYRNERQCGTFNAEPFVLSGPTASGTRERTTIIVPRAGRDR